MTNRSATEYFDDDIIEEETVAERLDSASPEVSQKNIYNKALYILARREHSQFELKQKLQKHFPQNSQIASILKQLIAEGLQNDKRFTECYTRFRSGRGFGPLKIANELYTRGIALELIEQVFSEEQWDWLQLATEVRNKKFGFKIPKPFIEQAKQMRFLQYRGFSVDCIKTIFDKQFAG